MKSFSICWKEFSEIHPENFSMIYKKNDQKRKFCDIIEVNILMQSFSIGNSVKNIRIGGLYGRKRRRNKKKICCN